MTTLRVELNIAADAGVVWALLKDFQHIAAFNPNLSRSIHIDGTPREGVGAERRCELKDGRNWIDERVVDWRTGESYTVEIYAGTMPIREVRTTLAVSPNRAGSRAIMQITYTPKFGPVGHLLDLLLLRGKMKELMESVLEGLRQKSVESLLAND
ncbi:SRPBCC family protein [Methylosinus sp. Sm6]|uniref:SRPBCC family protein n=1 Tax=Methylosinus sp. Sm6 TaxID=2866948 RepID=UPI001C997AA3|nr:SRPBCC family protein [Methylosinus sp. Sm6]MBY6244061.1 SRPBCC family protein [Methylosinus sp. Sm6]